MTFVFIWCFLIGLNVIKGLREMDLVFFLVKLCFFSYFVGVFECFSIGFDDRLLFNDVVFKGLAANL